MVADGYDEKYIPHSRIEKRCLAEEASYKPRQDVIELKDAVGWPSDIRYLS